MLRNLGLHHYHLELKFFFYVVSILGSLSYVYYLGVDAASGRILKIE